jgi:transposase
MNLLRRAQGCFRPGRDAAIAILREAEVVACDETGVRIEGSNAYYWLFHSAQAVVNTPWSRSTTSKLASEKL